MSKDYMEYKGFVKELKKLGIVDVNEIAQCFTDKFDYLAEDEITAIIQDVL